MTKLIIFAIFLGVAVFVVQLINKKGKGINKPDLSVFERKPFLFDTNSEFNLYKILLEMFGDKYYIFPQVNYSHLIQPKKSNWGEERENRSRIDRKSADFVFCDKEKIIPKLIIELDGSVHSLKSKQARDAFIDELTKIVDLPILHIKINNLDKEFIRKEIEEKLR